MPSIATLRHLPRAGLHIFVLAALVALVLAGCDSGGDTSSSETTGGKTDAESTEPEGKPGVPPPPDKETVEEAAARFKKAAEKPGCKEVYALLPFEVHGDEGEARCAAIKRTAVLPQAAKAEYAPIAGVVDYERPDGSISSFLLTRGVDGRFAIAAIDPTSEEPAAKTKVDSKQAIAVMGDVMAAYVKESCKDLYKLRFKGFGTESALEQSDVCPQLKTPFAKAIREPGVQPRLAGGNEKHAFFSASTPFGHYTVVLIDPKPGGDSDYEYFNARLTRRLVEGG